MLLKTNGEIFSAKLSGFLWNFREKLKETRGFPARVFGELSTKESFRRELEAARSFRKLSFLFFFPVPLLVAYLTKARLGLFTRRGKPGERGG